MVDSSREPDNFGVLTPWDEWAIKHCGMTANELLETWPELVRALKGEG